MVWITPMEWGRIMDRWQGWRRICGLGMLAVALLATGAWLKSAADYGAFGGPGKPYCILPLAGKVGLLKVQNPIEYPGHLPQIKWTIAGVYQDLTITSARAQVQPPPPDPAVSPVVAAGVFDKSTVPFSTDDSVENGLSQGGAPALLLTSSVQDLDIPFDPADQSESIVWLSNWCGFGVGRGTDTTMDDWWILIPHWAFVVPLWMVTAALLVQRGKSRKLASPVASPAPAVPWSGVIGGMQKHFRGWRKRTAIALALVSVFVCGGWLRSRSVSDLVNLSPDGSSRLLLVSGKQGLSIQHDVTGGNRPFTYSTRTGEAHERIQFHPVVPEVEPSAGPDFDFVVSPSGGELSQTAGQALLAEMQHSPEILQIAANAPLDQSGTTDWEGMSIEWCGLFFSRSPTDWTIVVSYGFVVAPLALLSALLLTWPRIGRAS